jgi:sulfate adenylyltransferase subunit 1 (EFTu-like GTPase family)
MNPQLDRQFVEDLRRALIKATNGCNIQEGADGKEWPCGTCVCDLLGRVMPETAPEYSQHNTPIDRVNEVWRAILQIRDYAGRA